MASASCSLASLFPPATAVLSSPSRPEVVWYQSATRMTELLGTVLDASEQRKLQADFVRFCRGRPVQRPEHTAFFTAILQRNELDTSTLRQLYQTYCAKTRPDVVTFAPKDHYLSYQLFGPFKQLATQFIEQGLHWNVGDRFALDASFLHARQQEDIRSSHQLWLRFYSNDANNIVDQGVQSIVRDEVGARIFLGWRGSYHRTSTVLPVVRAPFFVGGDVDMRMGSFYVGGSAQAGLPLTLATVVPSVHYTGSYWEVSLRAYRTDPNFFVGAGISPDLLDPSRRFYGAQAVLRI